MRYKRDQVVWVYVIPSNTKLDNEQIILEIFSGNIPVWGHKMQDDLYLISEYVIWNDVKTGCSYHKGHIISQIFTNQMKFHNAGSAYDIL